MTASVYLKYNSGGDTFFWPPQNGKKDYFVPFGRGAREMHPNGGH